MFGSIFDVLNENFGKHTIHSVKLEDGKLIVERSIENSLMMASYSTMKEPATRRRDTYGVKDGKIVLEKMLKAVYTPPVPEKHEFIDVPENQVPIEEPKPIIKHEDTLTTEPAQTLKISTGDWQSFSGNGGSWQSSQPEMTISKE